MRGAFIPGALTDGGLSERASAVLRGAKGSPKKFGAFLRVVRGLRAEDALIQCNLSPKRVAKTIGRVIQSAIGNAVNNQGLDRDRLVVAEATCGKGQYLRRVSIHGRGRGDDASTAKSRARHAGRDGRGTEATRARARRRDAVGTQTSIGTGETSHRGGCGNSESEEGARFRTRPRGFAF